MEERTRRGDGRSEEMLLHFPHSEERDVVGRSAIQGRDEHIQLVGRIEARQRIDGLEE